MKRSNFTFLFVFALMSYWATPAQSQTCIGDVNITMAADCSFDASPMDINGGAILFKIGAVTSGSGSFAAGALDAGCYSYEIHYADNTYCWGKVCLEAKLLPDFMADCIYTPGQHSERTVDVAPDGDIYDDLDGDGKNDGGAEELSDRMVLAKVTADSSCQYLTVKVTNNVKHAALRHLGTGADGVWVPDSLCWWVYENEVGGVVIDSGWVTTLGGMATDGEDGAFGSTGFDAQTDSMYILVVEVKEGPNPSTDYLTEKGTTGTATGGLWLTDCVPDCFTWCPSDNAALEDCSGSPLPGDGVLDKAAVQKLIDAEDCFAGVYGLTEEKIITGEICTPQNVINPSCSTDDRRGQLVRIVHSAKFPGLHGNPDEKRVVLEQAYVIGRPIPTMPSSVSTDPVELSCGDGTSPWEIYETLVAEKLAEVEPTDTKDDVYSNVYYYAANRSFPFIENYHDSLEVEVTFDGGFKHEVVEEVKTYKVLKYWNKNTNEIYGSSADCPMPDTLSNETCKPIWVKETIVEKTLKEVPADGTKTKYKVPEIHAFYDDELCGWSSHYTDWEFPACGGGKKIQRDWSILDWCSGQSSVMAGGQLIKVTDDVAPEVDEYDDVTLNVDPWTCAAVLELDDDFATDECSDLASQTWEANNGADVNGNKVTVWLSEGCVTVTGTANDECGNYATTSFEICVVDWTPPVAIAEDQVNVTLTGIGTVNSHGHDAIEGQAKVYYGAIDAGSHDSNCGEVDLCVIRDADFSAGKVYLPAGVWATDDEDGDGCEYREDPEPLIIDGKQAYIATNPCAGTPYTEYHTDKFCDNPTAYTVYYVTCDDYVKFCCEDAGQDHKIILQATDDAGNSSYSWGYVTVEDKSAPGGFYCVGYDLLCTEIDLFLEDIPVPTYGSTICPSTIDVEVDRYEIEELCGEGYIKVYYDAVDGDGNVIDSTYCVYDIEQPDDYGFDPYTIKWPKHYDGHEYYGVNLECDNDGDLVTTAEYIEMPDAFICESGAVLDEPVWCVTNCELILSSYEDTNVPDDASCAKIIRRWTVIDWCTWTPNSGLNDGELFDDDNDSYDNFEAVEDWTIDTDCDDCPNKSGALDNTYFRYKGQSDAHGNDIPGVDKDGYYTFDQIIVTRDEDAPTITTENVEASIVDGNDSKGDDPDFTDCVVGVQAEASVSDDCGGVETEGALILRWVIEDEDGDELDAGYDSPAGPWDLGAGEYTVTWTAQDACGNSSQAKTTITIEDGKNPTPVCLQDISTATMNVDNGGVTIWASDYDLGSFDNCSDVTVEFRDTSGNGVQSMTFDCDDITDGVSETFEIKLWVIDEAGNEDYCFVTLRVDDNADQCTDADAGASASIRGEIFTNNGNMIESAEVSLNRSFTDMTGVEGKYAFMNNSLNLDYEVSAEKNNDFINGVTTLDLVLIQQYVLGLGDLDQSPYNVIAADVNNNESITAADLVELRKLILGIYDELPNNTSWRFVDAGQQFSDFTDPFPFTETISISDLNNNSTNNNFVGVKIGDVSGSAIANSLQAGARSNASANFEIADATVKAGEIITVDFKAADLTDLTAFQGTFNLNGLEFSSIESGALDITDENLGVLDANTLTVAWFNDSPVEASDVLFSLNLKATSNVALSEGLTLNSNVTTAIAYDGDNNEFDLGLSLTSGEGLGTFALFQNEPNPFGESTQIRFNLPQAAHAQLTVFDVTGKVVSVIDGDFNKGINNVSVRKSDLNATGVLYYQLESGEFSATRKMVLLD